MSYAADYLFTPNYVPFLSLSKSTNSILFQSNEACAFTEGAVGATAVVTELLPILTVSGCMTSAEGLSCGVSLQTGYLSEAGFIIPLPVSTTPIVLNVFEQKDLQQACLVDSGSIEADSSISTQSLTQDLSDTLSYGMEETEYVELMEIGSIEEPQKEGIALTESDTLEAEAQEATSMLSPLPEGQDLPEEDCAWEEGSLESPNYDCADTGFDMQGTGNEDSESEDDSKEGEFFELSAAE